MGCSSFFCGWLHSLLLRG
uniref:Uncharacterized protein n=1 Tax=Arundo donax TaxID=35708 RepID=A0A0A9C0W9_ARUDO